MAERITVGDFQVTARCLVAVCGWNGKKEDVILIQLGIAENGKPIIGDYCPQCGSWQIAYQKEGEDEFDNCR